MTHDLDQLLGVLRDTSVSGGTAGLEDAVWRRIRTRGEKRAAAGNLLKTELTVAGAALAVGIAFAAHTVPMMSPPVYSETLVLSDDASITPSMNL